MILEQISLIESRISIIPPERTVKITIRPAILHD